MKTLIGAFFVFVVSLALLSIAHAAAPRPNFLVILTDDQRADAFGAAGNPHVRTPHLDRLAARGVRFTQSFVATSICSPSRAAHLTGRYGSGNGVMDLQQTRLKPGEKTWAQALQAAGYRTSMVGKWHLTNTPQSLGFDEATFFHSNGAYYRRKVNERGKVVEVPGHLEDYTAEQAVRFLHEAADDKTPFSLWLCTQLPHLDDRFRWNAKPETLRLFDAARLPVPAAWPDDLAGKPPYLKEARHHTRAVEEYGYDRRENVQAHLRDYYATIADMDTALGRVFAALDDHKLRDNTYIVFSSDNGWLLGEHKMTSKVLAYEESMRVPMLIVGPGIEPRVDDRLVLNVDIAPTLLDLAGLAVPENLHGRSLAPLLRKTDGDDRGPWRDAVLYEAIKPELGSWPLLAVRTQRWKYIRTFEAKSQLDKIAFEELYDLKTDPGEMQNLAREPTHAATLAELRTMLERMQPSRE